MLVFFIVVIYGFWRNGLHFLNLFVPKGVPVYIWPGASIHSFLPKRMLIGPYGTVLTVATSRTSVTIRSRMDRSEAALWST